MVHGHNMQFHTYLNRFLYFVLYVLYASALPVFPCYTAGSFRLLYKTAFQRFTTHYHINNNREGEKHYEIWLL